MGRGLLNTSKGQMIFLHNTFQVFYFSHLLYWAYWALLVLHCPDFWLWLVIPGTVFVFFKIYRFLRTLIGSGKTSIRAGILLPGKVTNLIIERPSKFAYSPGDWIFVKIPEISRSEWHPFTISSAPEQKVYHFKN